MPATHHNNFFSTYIEERQWFGETELKNPIEEPVLKERQQKDNLKFEDKLPSPLP